MTAHPKKKISISLLIPFLVFVVFFSVMILQKYRSSQEVVIAPASHNKEGRRTIILYFAAEDGHLARESREIETCDNADACLESIVEELLNGPVGEYEEVVPEGTVVNYSKIDVNQAIIDFNLVFSDAMLSGSSAEMLAVYSVINTVTVNFPQIQKVKLNIDGNSAAILRHLDLSDPLPPDYTLEKSVPSVSEKASTGLTTNHKGDHR